MFNKIAKTVKKQKLKADQKRLKDIMGKVVDIFNEEKVTIFEMGIIVNTMNDMFKDKIKK